MEINVSSDVSIPLSSRQPHFLRKFVERCLERNPKKRFTSAMELKEILSTMKTWEGIADAQEKTRELIPQMLPQNVRALPARMSLNTFKVSRSALIARAAG